MTPMELLTTRGPMTVAQIHFETGEDMTLRGVEDCLREMQAKNLVEETTDGKWVAKVTPGKRRDSAGSGNSSRDLILAKLADGPASVAVLAKAAGVTKSNVFYLLGKLKKEGKVENVRRGVLKLSDGRGSSQPPSKPVKKGKTATPPPALPHHWIQAITVTAQGHSVRDCQPMEDWGSCQEALYQLEGVVSAEIAEHLKAARAFIEAVHQQ